MKCAKEYIAKEYIKKCMKLYAVTDRAWTGNKTLYQQVEETLKGGATCVQLREKMLSYEEFLKEAIEIKALCKKYNVPLFINDNVDIAVKCKADGIHVGQEDMACKNVREKVGPDMIIGVSAHNVKEAKEAVKNGADCLGVGAMFSTSTKPDADVLSYETLKGICDAVEVPVVAIGGINENNIMELAGTGVDGVAIVSAIFSAENIEEKTRELLKKSGKMISKKPTKCAIFDFDGTIFDSMHVWDLGSARALKEYGIENDDIDWQQDDLKVMTILEGVEYIIKRYNLNETPENFVNLLNKKMEEEYLYNVLPKPGMKDLLEEMYEKGIRMSIATANEKSAVEAALKRCEMEKYFERIFTVPEVGIGKTHPDLYRMAMNFMGCTQSESLVFEDAAHALCTANEDGFGTVGVYDPSENDQEKFRKNSDLIFYDYRDEESRKKFRKLISR